MTIKDIEKEISQLQMKKHELVRQEAKEFQEKAKENVGRCFIENGRIYCKVIGVPRLQELRSGPYINEYQYPAIELAHDEEESDNPIPFHYTTIFSGAWGVGNNLFGETYKEITPQEFEEEFNKRLEEFRQKVL